MHRMRASIAPVGVDHRIAALAEAQFGVVARWQLSELGLERGAIGRRLGAGRLHRLHAGVYAVGHDAHRPEAVWIAAVLACGARAVLSHRSAAALWAIRAGEGPHPDVTVPTRNGRRRPGIVIHRSPLAASDVVVRAGIAVTSPARTLVDLDRILDDGELVRAVRETQYLGLFDLAAIEELLGRRPSRRLRGLVEDPVLTESALEDRFLAICDRFHIARPVTQQPLGRRRVDFLWPRERVVVETDGWQGHGTRSAFQIDRATSNDLQLAGYAVLRFTHADVTKRPADVARQVRGALTAGT